MSCTPLPKAAKPVWAKQLTRLPCLVVYFKFQFVYTTKIVTRVGEGDSRTRLSDKRVNNKERKML